MVLNSRVKDTRVSYPRYSVFREIYIKQGYVTFVTLVTLLYKIHRFEALLKFKKGRMIITFGFICNWVTDLLKR